MGNYVVISPAKDEGRYIEKTIQSMIGQSLTPRKWVIVDDDYRDETPQIVARYAECYPWIKLFPLVRDGERKPGSAVINAFMAGYELIRNDSFDFVIKLDCDLEIPEEYFETLLSRFQADPKLGIASGSIWSNPDKSWKPVKMPESVAPPVVPRWCGRSASARSVGLLPSGAGTRSTKFAPK